MEVWVFMSFLMFSLTLHELNLLLHKIIFLISRGKNFQNFLSETCLNQYTKYCFLTVIFNHIL